MATPSGYHLCWLHSNPDDKAYRAGLDAALEDVARPGVAAELRKTFPAA